MNYPTKYPGAKSEDGKPEAGDERHDVKIRMSVDNLIVNRDGHDLRRSHDDAQRPQHDLQRQVDDDRFRQEAHR